MAARVTLRRACIIALIAASPAAIAQRLAPPAYQLAASRAGVPAEILFAVALQESGMMLNGRLVPWPWTLNIAGKPMRYVNRRDACTALLRALRESAAVDVGLGQVSAKYHGHRVRSVCELLDPYRNLAVAAAILSEQHASGEDWSTAVGRYHRPAGGGPADRYRRRVERHLTRLVGPALASATLRGSSP